MHSTKGLMDEISVGLRYWHEAKQDSPVWQFQEVCVKNKQTLSFYHLIW